MLNVISHHYPVAVARGFGQLSFITMLFVILDSYHGAVASDCTIMSLLHVVLESYHEAVSCPFIVAHIPPARRHPRAAWGPILIDYNWLFCTTTMIPDGFDRYRK